MKTKMLLWNVTEDTLSYLLNEDHVAYPTDICDLHTKYGMKIMLQAIKYLEKKLYNYLYYN